MNKNNSQSYKLKAKHKILEHIEKIKDLRVKYLSQKEKIDQFEIKYNKK